VDTLAYYHQGVRPIAEEAMRRVAEESEYLREYTGQGWGQT
jgi:hypothetical protein